MATWKKISVSGSNISQFNNDAGYLTSNTNAFSTASINGVNLLADTNNGILSLVTASGEGITAVGTPGTDTVTLGLSSIPNSSLANSTVYISGSGISNEGSVALGATASIDVQVDDSTIGLTGNSLQVKDGSIGTTQIADSLGTLGTNQFTGSFTGSFTGDGSGLTGLATTLTIGAESGTDGTVDLQTEILSFSGSSNEIETSVSGQTITIGLPDDVVIAQDLTVTRDLTVQGTASFESRNDLLVADRFILMASGSEVAGDGGIVVQQDTQNIGELFGFDSGTSRWAVTSSFNAGTSAFSPSAFMATVIEGTGTDPDAVDAQYDKKGNIFVGTDEEIWIYS